MDCRQLAGLPLEPSIRLSDASTGILRIHFYQRYCFLYRVDPGLPLEPSIRLFLSAKCTLLHVKRTSFPRNKWVVRLLVVALGSRPRGKHFFTIKHT